MDVVTNVWKIVTRIQIICESVKKINQFHYSTIIPTIHCCLKVANIIWKIVVKIRLTQKSIKKINHFNNPKHNRITPIIRCPLVAVSTGLSNGMLGPKCKANVCSKLIMLHEHPLVNAFLFGLTCHKFSKTPSPGSQQHASQ